MGKNSVSIQKLFLWLPFIVNNLASKRLYWFSCMCGHSIQNFVHIWLLGSLDIVVHLTASPLAKNNSRKS